MTKQEFLELEPGDIVIQQGKACKEVSGVLFEVLEKRYLRIEAKPLNDLIKLPTYDGTWNFGYQVLRIVCKKDERA